MNVIFQNLSELYELIIRFTFNLLVTLVIVRVIYYRITKRKDYLFTFSLISSLVFLLCFLMSNVNLQLGFALGLFAVFGILRYRTTGIPIKEMTYLFVIIGLSVMNALASGLDSLLTLLFANTAIIVLIYVFEHLRLFKHESHKVIIYNNLLLIVPAQRSKLIQDLELKTGLKINRLEIGKIDFAKNRVKLIIYYYGENNALNMADDFTENIDDE